MDASERGLSASDCPVCYHQLGEGRIPYSLTCGHTVCWICVKRLSRGTCNFLCPLCRESVDLASVKRNVTLLQLISQLHQGTYTSFSSALTTPFESIELGRLLDRGANGEVYRGKWQGNDVAIKVFCSGQISDEITESFRKEVCIMNTLRHPNVVLLLAASPIPPKLAIIMEYVGGGSLYSHLYIEKTVLSTDFIAHLLANITQGLQYLHSINILHRDLKSKNVLLTGPPPTCQAKLCDFGLARMRLESATMTGNVGTVHWTAPEVLNCARYHFSADVYSLGMVIYEIISRSIPFSNLPPPAVIVAVLIKRNRPTPPQDTNATLLELYNRCTSWEPSERPSILSILRDLNSLLPEQQDSVKENDDFSFDHTDSLGHVMIDLELDADEDEDLLRLLLQEQSDNDVDLIDTNEPKHPLKQQNMIPDEVYEDTRGVLSQQELDVYHNKIMTKTSTNVPTYGYSAPTYRPSYFDIFPIAPVTNTTQRSNSFSNVPLIPANSLRPHYQNVTQQRSNEVYQQHSSEATPSEGTPSKTIMADFIEDTDRQFALQLQEEERKRLASYDYKLASSLQERENRVGQIVPTPPPMPPPTQSRLPLQQIPYKITPKQIVLSQVKQRRFRNLKPVETVVKRLHPVGRVVGDIDNDVINFTLQKEIAAFPKGWLHKVELQEPAAPYPLGKVIEKKENRVKNMIHRVNSLTQLQIKEYNKELLKPVTTKVKYHMPTVEDIFKEKNPSPSPPLPSPPPLPQETSLPSTHKKVKSRVLSPYKKKAAMFSSSPATKSDHNDTTAKDAVKKSYTKKVASSKSPTEKSSQSIEDDFVILKHLSEEKLIHKDDRTKGRKKKH